MTAICRQCLTTVNLLSCTRSQSLFQKLVVQQLVEKKHCLPQQPEHPDTVCLSVLQGLIYHVKYMLYMSNFTVCSFVLIIKILTDLSHMEGFIVRIFLSPNQVNTYNPSVLHKNLIEMKEIQLRYKGLAEKEKKRKKTKNNPPPQSIILLDFFFFGGVFIFLFIAVIRFISLQEQSQKEDKQ